MKKTIRLIRPPEANLSPSKLRQWLKENFRYASALMVWIASGRIDQEILREACIAQGCVGFWCRIRSH